MVKEEKTKEFLISDSCSLRMALDKINTNKKGFLLVHDSEERVIGTLTDGDIRRALLKDSDLDDAVTGYNLNFVYLKSTSEFTNAITIFKQRDIDFIPVLTEDNHLYNVITKGALHTLLLQDIQPEMDYDFLEIDDTALDHAIFERPWGFYKSTILNSMYQSKVISVRPKASLSLQEHKKREEHWIVVKGEGQVRIGDSIKTVNAGTYLFIPKGCKHRMTNTSETDTLILIEVQLGQYFGEDDIIRFEDDYGRI